MLKKITKFIDENILLILSILLLLVIPLYPKLPIFDIIPGYIVRVRIEDFLILFTNFVFLIQVIRKKATLKTPLTKIIFAYAVVGILSILSGIFITKTIPTTFVHLSKSALHYLRYLEYFSLFFIFYSSIKSKKQLKILITTAVISFFLVGIYGLGQKYLYWPVYSTMNREFSKGIRLYLTEHARVQSTFGGHYDMAAYLVIILPIILLMTKISNKKTIRIFYWVVFSLGMWLMVTGASRTSFVASLIGIFLTILVRSFKEDDKKKKIKYFLSQSLITGILTLSIFSIFGDDISERLLQSLNSYPVFAKNYQIVTNKITQTKDYINYKLAEQNIDTEIKIEKPENGLSTEEAAILVASDERPKPLKPSDVFVDVPDRIEVATISATGVKSTITIDAPRTYSDNALKYGLSLAIRLDTLWPQAIKGFYTNPLLGSGYGTLTKSQVDEFTEADSTDNNFLRTLGELGLLGFITFYGAVVLAIIQAYKITFKKDLKIFAKEIDLKAIIGIAFIGSSIGLLINAIFIDVFAASKVALTFWSITGILFGLDNIINDEDSLILKQNKKRNRIKKGKFKNTPSK
ncbi:O-antigen ligase family protein [Candidatus Woesebacteria bacterium]|nr:O-antigen ligase family protein [Candidatus Woesebacteria bacterium]